MTQNATPSSSAVHRDTLSHDLNQLEHIHQRPQQEQPAINHEDAEDAEEEMKEQPLDSSELIELQAFVKHKEWIEEKIKILERMPPLDIFIGADELEQSFERTSTLPTRVELDSWISEHDRIEQETETLDSGDLKKLKTLTKAATQRNLSPEDTDLIEITLTTLFALDRLHHLLRDRSEHLDLLDLRLSWEEHRVDAYSTRATIIATIHDFLQNRARWKPTVTGATSDEVRSEATARELSCEARESLAESISRECLKVSSSISVLRERNVIASGKVLDILLDSTRKPVPEAMLDEQDRVEALCDRELAYLPRFLQAAVMQWRKADEIHSDSMRDSNSLQALIERAREASQAFPSPDVAKTLSDTLAPISDRVLARSNALSTSKFPQPTHPLFEGQEAFNQELVRQLQAEIHSTQMLVAKVTPVVEAYRSGCAFVQFAEELQTEALQLETRINSAIRSFKHGLETGSGEGSRPDLTQATCLELSNHASYLAMLPNFVLESEKTEATVSEWRSRAKMASLRLDVPGVDAGYKANFVSIIDRLDERSQMLREAEVSASSDASKLRTIRQIWFAMDDISKATRHRSAELREALLKHRWKQQIGGTTAPLTPESPQTDLPSDCQPVDFFDAAIQDLISQMECSVSKPWAAIRDTLLPTLSAYIDQRRSDVERELADFRTLDRLLSRVRQQSSVMASVQNEVHELEDQMDETQQEYDKLHSSILQQDAATDFIDNGYEVECAALSASFESFKDKVDKLLSSLPTRIPFIAQQTYPDSVHQALDLRKDLLAFLPFDPTTVDRAVRNDSNSLTTRLSGGINSIARKRSFTRVYRLAKEVDRRFRVIQDAVLSLENAGKTCDDSLGRLMKGADGATNEFNASLDQLGMVLDEAMNAQTFIISQHMTEICSNVDEMRSVPHVQEDNAVTQILLLRASRADELNLSVHRIVSYVKSLQVKVSNSKKARSLPPISEDAPKKAFTLAPSPIIDDSTPTRKRPGFKEDDVFGPATPVQQVFDKDTLEILSRIRSLRKRLKSIGINSAIRPVGTLHRHSSSFTLPSQATAEDMSEQFALLEIDTVKLPESMSNTSANTELRSLRLEMEASRELLDRVHQLSSLQSSVVACDTKFSELLDHVDCYPERPQTEIIGTGSAVSLHLQPGEFLRQMVASTTYAVDNMDERFTRVRDDPRAVAEHGRLMQTWSELSEMALEKLSGRSSGAGSMSAQSSTDFESASSATSDKSASKKNHYSKLSVSSQNGIYSTPVATKRRAASAATPTVISTSKTITASRPARMPPRQSLSTSKPINARSVSGPSRAQSPTKPTNFRSPLNTTFASRQRTSSLASNASSPAITGRPSISSARRMSSATSEATRTSGPSSARRSSFARAPRTSLSSLQRETTPEKASRPKSKYVANPKNKLDMALGDVINNLPVDINVEAVVDTWKDKSGKYWIGGEEPKLCFCRILRSQTVMVRVGGGWVEASRFIKDHFADLFRVAPETPPRPGSKEKWISASSLKSMDNSNIPKGSPGSPDSIGRHLPSFALSSPDGSRQSGSPGPGSPLTPLQFIRRADADASEFSLTSIALSNGLSDLSNQSNLKSPSLRPKKSFSSFPAKAAWRL